MKKRLLVLFAAVAALLLTAYLAVPSLLPWCLNLYRADICFRAPTNQKRIYVTIDDAPSSKTKAILDVLKTHEVPATFFIISGRVQSDSQLQEIATAGYALGNHLNSTTRCSNLSLLEFQRSLDICTDILSPHQKSKFFRPASDFGTREQIAYAHSKGYLPVMGTVFPMDHWITNRTCLVNIAYWLSIHGGIIILHDGENRGEITAAALDHLIPKLKNAGYTFGKLDEITTQ